MPVRLASRPKYRARQQSRHLTIVVAPSPQIAAARNDLGAFGEYVCGKVPAEIHRSWFPHLATGANSECLNLIAGENTNLLSFRGSAKTTWARIWLAWAIGHNPHIQTGWISYNESTALKSSRVIKRIIASQRYQEIFPHVRPGSRWADTDWEIDKAYAGVSTFDSDFTLAALGITGGITSNRFHLTVYDDLIKSSQQIKNAEIREKMVENYGEVIEPCVEAVPGSRQVSLGTRFRADDIHATEFTPENGWKVIEQGAIVMDENGQERPAWERIPLTRLYRIRQRRPIIFSYQWMNQIPQLADEQSITEDDFQYIDAAEIPDFVELILGIDLAASEDEKNDFTAFVLGGRKDDRIIILEAQEYRIKGNLKKIQEVMALWKRWRHKAQRLRIVFGKPAYQKSFEGDWQDYKRRYNVQSVTCEGVVENLDKDEKREAISGVFQDRIVYFNRAKNFGRLVAQLIGADLEHDDLADGCYFCLSKLQRRVRRALSSA
jgi:phage terminase large subunit-like protein